VLGEFLEFHASWQANLPAPASLQGQTTPPEVSEGGLRDCLPFFTLGAAKPATEGGIRKAIE